MQVYFKERQKLMWNDEKKQEKKINGNPCFLTNQMFKKQTYKRIKKIIVRKKRLELARVSPPIL